MKLNEFINSSTNNITTEMPALSMKEHQQTEVSNSSQTLQDNSFVKNGLGEALNNIIDESLTPNFYFLRISFKKS